MGTQGGGGGGGGCGELNALDSTPCTSKCIKGEGEGLISSADVDWNPGIWVGVLGDESSGDSDDEDVSKLVGFGPVGDRDFLVATGVTLESSESILVSWVRSVSIGFVSGFMRAVLALELLDFAETFDLVAVFSLYLPDDEFPELDRDSSDCSSSCNLETRLGVAFRCCETSVSGGLGGLPLFVTLVLRVTFSVDLEFSLSAELTSVGFGVYGSTFPLAGVRKSSLLLTASLLYVLLNVGYGKLLREFAPGADAVRANSGIKSAMEDEAWESLSLSFLRRRIFTGSPVTGSIALGRAALASLRSRLASFSSFVRCRRSLGRSSKVLSRSL